MQVALWPWDWLSL